LTLPEYKLIVNKRIIDAAWIPENKFMLETITSIKDEKITLARAIKSRKGRQDFHKILLEARRFLIGLLKMPSGLNLSLQ